MALLNNPVKCPFCADQITLTQRQLDTLNADGDKSIEIDSVTCSAHAVIEADAGFHLSGNPRAIANASQTGQIVEVTNVRIHWTRSASTEVTRVQRQP